MRRRRRAFFSISNTFRPIRTAIFVSHRISGAIKVFLCCLVLGTGGASRLALAQSASIRGFATDASDGQPLQGVNVTLRGTDDTFLGAATDADGYYAVSRIGPGTYVFAATFIGYSPHVDTLTLAAGEALTVNVALSPDESELDEVVVESEREGTGAAGISAGLQRVRPGDIELVPSPDVSGDLVSYIGMMPGVVSSGDRGGQLFIRGGEPSQNLVLLDGMLVYQPFHLVGFYSAFPSDIIQSTDVYAGGFGGRPSSTSRRGTVTSVA